MQQPNNTLQIQWQQYENPQALPATEQSLLRAAKDAVEKAYAPYSNFYVGAAVLLASGEILSGANFENAAYPMCLCAERSALANAISTFPEGIVTMMAITVRNPKQVIQTPAAPCGACRQVMVEAEYRQQSDMQVILQGEQGPVYVLASAKALLPFHFDGSFL